MLERKFGKNTLYVSKQYLPYLPYSDSELFLERNNNALIRLFTRRKLFKELMDLYGRKNGLEGFLLLKSDGVRGVNNWMFNDGKRLYNVQNFINRNDGNYLAILLYFCNPRDKNNKQLDFEIHANRSILFHFKDEFNLAEFSSRKRLPRIYVPGEGYLDNNYRLKKSMDKFSYG